MTPADVIREARLEGVALALSGAGTIKATGDGAAVYRWLAVIREHKAAIIEALKAAAGETATSEHERRQTGLAMRAEEETAIRAWLDRIGETDPGQIAAALRVCADDEPSRRWCLALARGHEAQRH